MSKKKKTFGEGFGKNLQKVKDMVDGTYDRKLVIGQYSPTEEVHKVGDTWTDSEGYEWEQKEGFKVKKSVMPEKGIADNCSDCDRYIVNKRDKTFYTKFKRCFYCQINFETELQLYPLKYWAWQRLQKLNAWESIDKEALQWFEEKEKEQNKKIWDKTVANALANANIDMSIKKNTQ